ncbi:MAG: DUF4918 family protein [Bacteroidetes bacterium]|nr:DUF4918 family protein [Bacteroidota bacterium]MBS1629078.1 DUF4918 family protein [Bacteroidota bacterium]
MDTFSDRVKAFNRSLLLKAKLPEGVQVMNPFRDSPLALRISDAFYDKFYQDKRKRFIVLGINPGRFGAGLSGVPFTDFKRLEQDCGISAEGQRAHEPSSEFIYEMIRSMGGVEAFYADFYINSVCPLGFVKDKGNKRMLNYNYYDEPALAAAVTPFIVASINRQIALGCYPEACISLGVKNADFLQKINEKHRFFKRIIVLPHPRFVMQYRRKELAAHLVQYHEAFSLLREWRLGSGS